MDTALVDFLNIPFLNFLFHTIEINSWLYLEFIFGITLIVVVIGQRIYTPVFINASKINSRISTVIGQFGLWMQGVVGLCAALNGYYCLTYGCVDADPHVLLILLMCGSIIVKVQQLIQIYNLKVLGQKEEEINFIQW